MNNKTASVRNIHTDLKILLPDIIADTVSQQHSKKLVELAEHLYRTNRAWAAQITDDDGGRDTLKAFMRHWLDGYQTSGRWIDAKKEPSK